MVSRLPVYAVLISGFCLCAADLHQAVRAGDLDAVKQLIGSGVNVNARDTLGATPLHDCGYRKIRSD